MARIEFGSGRVAQVHTSFLGGPTPAAEVVGPFEALTDDKRAFAATRRARLFGAADPG